MSALQAMPLLTVGEPRLYGLRRVHESWAEACLWPDERGVFGGHVDRMGAEHEEILPDSAWTKECGACTPPRYLEGGGERKQQWGPCRSPKWGRLLMRRWRGPALVGGVYCC